MAASAAERFASANNRALSPMSLTYVVAIERSARFHWIGVLSDQKYATSVCSGVRRVLADPPTALTSSKASAYSRLVSAGGSFARNCDVLFTANGVTCA